MRTVLLLSSVLLFVAQFAFCKDVPKPHARLGMNLNSLSSYTSELPFVDVFRTSKFVSQQNGQPFGKGPKFEVDERGWIKRLDTGCFAEVIFCVLEAGHYPAGEYTLTYEGDGKLSFKGATIVSQETGKMVIRTDAPQGGFSMQIQETNPSNYIRNIHLFMPGFDEKSDRFHPVFTERWAGFACYRYMDLMRTNGSPVSLWEERPLIEDATWTRRGAPLEVLIELSNKQKVAPWFCMPHRADDNYIRKFAEMVKEKLDPSLPIYIEYSNEVWNGMFPQAKYAAAKAKELGIEPADKPWEIACKFYATRSVEIFKIWNEVFSADADKRLVRVLAWQAASSPTAWVKRLLLATANAGEEADALAIAPYFSLNVRGSGKDFNATTVGNGTPEQILDRLEENSLPRAISYMKAHAAVASEAGLLLLCYEAGQHAVGIQGGENNMKATKIFNDANRHPRMGALYKTYMDGWKEAGGDVMAIFSSTAQFSKWGSWGIMEYYDSLPSESPKYQAVVQWAKSQGQPVQEVSAKK